MTLVSPDKLEVKLSPIHGYGVFATEDIIRGEIIEECYAIKIPVKRGVMPHLFADYKFRWINENDEIEEVLPLGFGCIYNHSKNNNALWRQITEKKVIQFYALKDIKKGEEVCHFYGGDEYWDAKAKIQELS